MSENININNGKCMSYIAKNKRKMKCNRNIINNTDFCGYHQNKKKYSPSLLKTIRTNDIKKYNIDTRSLIKSVKELCLDYKINTTANFIINKINTNTEYLNKNKNQYLLGITKSWNNIPYEKRIELVDSNEYWNIDLILNQITQQLNQSNMENPYPIYPSSPFNRNPYTVKDLMNIKNKITSLNIKINIALKLFLNCDKKYINIMYDQANSNISRFSSNLRTLFIRSFRFKLINYKDSQNCYTGYWTNNKEPMSRFELIHKTWMDTPYQSYYNEMIVENQQKEELKNILESMNKEFWNIYDDTCKVYINT